MGLIVREMALLGGFDLVRDELVNYTTKANVRDYGAIDYYSY